MKPIPPKFAALLREYRNSKRSGQPNWARHVRFDIRDALSRERLRRLADVRETLQTTYERRVIDRLLRDVRDMSDERAVL